MTSVVVSIFGNYSAGREDKGKSKENTIIYMDFICLESRL